MELLKKMLALSLAAVMLIGSVSAAVNPSKYSLKGGKVIYLPTGKEANKTSAGQYLRWMANQKHHDAPTDNSASVKDFIITVKDKPGKQILPVTQDFDVEIEGVQPTNYATMLYNLLTPGNVWRVFAGGGMLLMTIQNIIKGDADAVLTLIQLIETSFVIAAPEIVNDLRALYNSLVNA